MSPQDKNSENEPQAEQPGNTPVQPDGPADPQAGAQGSDVSWKEKYEAAASDRDTNYDRWLRSQAELENVRRRAKKELEDFARYEGLGLIRNLLPTLDNLRRAIDAAEQSGNSEGLVQGVKMVVQQMESVLSNYSVKPIEAQGQPFDYNEHEAIQQIPTSDYPPMTVIQEVERGYKLHDRVIRPTKVIVAAPPQES